MIFIIFKYQFLYNECLDGLDSSFIIALLSMPFRLTESHEYTNFINEKLRTNSLLNSVPLSTSNLWVGGIIRPLLYILLNALKTVLASLFLRALHLLDDMQALLILEIFGTFIFRHFAGIGLLGSICLPY